MPNMLDFNAQIHNIYPVCDLLMSEMACIQDFFKDCFHTVINDGYLDQYIACFVHLNVKTASQECEIINYLYRSWDYDCRGIKIFFTHLHDRINKTPFVIFVLSCIYNWLIVFIDPGVWSFQEYFTPMLWISMIAAN